MLIELKFLWRSNLVPFIAVHLLLSSTLVFFSVFRRLVTITSSYRVPIKPFNHEIVSSFGWNSVHLRLINHSSLGLVLA